MRTTLRYFYPALVALVIFILSLENEVLAQQHSTPGGESAMKCQSNMTGITVSGLSSGAFMSTQLFVAYSSLFDAQASFAGGPFYSSLGNVATAMSIMSNPSLIDVHRLIALTTTASHTLVIDNLGFLAGKKAYLFSGTKDSVVHPGVVRHLHTFLTRLNVQSFLDDDIPAEHAMPTTDFGHPCSYIGSPYINACNLDGAGQALKYILEDPTRQYKLREKVHSSPSSLFAIQQGFFAPDYAKFTLDMYGLQALAYAYIPSKCRASLRSSPLRQALYYSKRSQDTLFATSQDDIHNDVGDDDMTEYNFSIFQQVLYDLKNQSSSTSSSSFNHPGGDLTQDQLEEFALRNAQRNILSSSWFEDGIDQQSESDGDLGCPVHVALHGCKQTVDHIGSAFIEHSGYNTWAEANNIIILYPQAKTILLTNPNGCWDWWGYSGPNFATKLGVQMNTIANMAHALRTGKLSKNLHEAVETLP